MDVADARELGSSTEMLWEVPREIVPSPHDHDVLLKEGGFVTLAPRNLVPLECFWRKRGARVTQPPPSTRKTFRSQVSRCFHRGVEEQEDATNIANGPRASLRTEQQYT